VLQTKMLLHGMYCSYFASRSEIARYAA
jgi:hypothetical protein